MVVSVICVGGAKYILDRAVILAFLIYVAHQQTDGSTCGNALEHSRQNFYLISLAPLGGVFALAGLAAIKVRLKVILRQRQSRRTTIDNRAQSQAVAFAKGSHGEK